MMTALWMALGLGLAVVAAAYCWIAALFFLDGMRGFVQSYGETAGPPWERR